MARMPGPRSLSSALSELIALRGIARVRGVASLETHWNTAAGAKIAAATKVLGIKNGVLHIGVQSAPLMGELASFHKQSLLEAMQAQHGRLEIRDIKFRLKRSLSR